MSNSVLPGEEASWAQTFITVTPHDDGFLREIEENVVVSGPGDTPFHLDTWNIVLRRSLVNTKDWIDSSELEQSKRVETECQTYLQGVPKVELPLAYRDEATQTLYMGRDGLGMEYFDDIINVLNEKILPEQTTTQVTQTIITMKDIVSENDIITMLVADLEIVGNDSQSSIDNTDKESGCMEASDILNFVVERALWISTSQSSSRKEKKDCNVQTSLMYNHRTKKVTIDYEVQTELTCEPKYSNSMLLADYNETKNFCRDRVNQCIESGVYPRIDIENIVEEIITKCKQQMNFSPESQGAIFVKSSASNLTDVASSVGRVESSMKNVESSMKNVESSMKNVASSPEYLPNFFQTDDYDVRKVTSNVEKTSKVKVSDGSKSERCKCRITSEVNRITRPIRDALLSKNESCCHRKSYKFTPRCNATSWRSESTSESTECTSSSGSSEPSSSSGRCLPTQDVQALGVLKKAFCSRDAAAKR